MAKINKGQCVKNITQMQALNKYINAANGRHLDEKLENFYDNFVMSVMGKGDKSSIVKNTKETGIYTELTGVTSYIPHKEESGYSIRENGTIYGKIGDMYFMTSENTSKTISRPMLSFFVMGNNDSIQSVRIFETNNHKEIEADKGSYVFNGFILKAAGMDEVKDMPTDGNYKDNINYIANTPLKGVKEMCDEVDSLRKGGFDSKLISDAMSGQVLKHRAELVKLPDDEMEK